MVDETGTALVDAPKENAVLQSLELGFPIKGRISEKTPLPSVAAHRRTILDSDHDSLKVDDGEAIAVLDVDAICSRACTPATTSASSLSSCSNPCVGIIFAESLEYLVGIVSS